MKLHRIIKGRVPTSFAVGVACALSVAACGGGGSGQMSQQTTTGFTDIAMVSNNVGVVATGTTIDANLSNPWGLATAPGLPFWIADNNSNLATLYSGTGANQTTEVTGSNAVGIAIPASATGVPANSNGRTATEPWALANKHTVKSKTQPDCLRHDPWHRFGPVKFITPRPLALLR